MASIITVAVILLGVYPETLVARRRRCDNTISGCGGSVERRLQKPISMDPKVEKMGVLADLAPHARVDHCARLYRIDDGQVRLRERRKCGVPASSTTFTAVAWKRLCMSDM